LQFVPAAWAQFRGKLTGEAASALEALALPSVRLHLDAGQGSLDVDQGPLDVDNVCPGQDRAAGGPASAGTRFGGVPLVSGDFAWPHTEDGRPLCLIAHVDTDQVNGWAGERLLPAGVLLNFFFDAVEQATWGCQPQDAHYWRVIAAEPAGARPAQAPDGAIAFTARSVTGQPVSTMPWLWEPAFEAVAADHGVDDTAYGNLDAEEESPRHRLLGWPEPQQGSMQRDCQLVSSGVDLWDPADLHHPRVEALAAGADDWRLLLQVDSDEGGADEWLWGDMGMLYFWIRRQDLAAGRFDRVWGMIQG
jgi:uncharacterized protein YwqG